MIRFLLLFLLIQMVLFTVELLQPVQVAVIIPWTQFLADLSAWLVTLFDPDVVAHGKVLRHTGNGFAVSIEAGCNGVEATIVLLAAILAFPASWKHKLLGFALGFVAIQALNLVRIISLFYLGQWDYEVFEWAHLYVWQALIMLDALIVFLVWLRMLPPRPVARVAG
jgi:exosortase H (IPTLxxWG-CTERM-specific)